MRNISIDFVNINTISSTRISSLLHKYLDDVFHTFMTFSYILVTLFLFTHSLYDMSSQSHITETNLLTSRHQLRYVTGERSCQVRVSSHHSMPWFCCQSCNKHAQAVHRLCSNALLKWAVITGAGAKSSAMFVIYTCFVSSIESKHQSWSRCSVT